MIDRIERDYVAALLRYLPRRDEAPLLDGYELGRAALTSGVSVLELAEIHHAALVRALEETPPEEVRGVAAAASEFFLAVLGAADMAQRGFLDEISQRREAHDTSSR